MHNDCWKDSIADLDFEAGYDLGNGVRGINHLLHTNSLNLREGGM